MKRLASRTPTPPIMSPGRLLTDTEVGLNRNPDEKDVVVVGAGPAGLMLA